MARGEGIHRNGLWDRLARRGFSQDELSAFRSVLEAIFERRKGALQWLIDGATAVDAALAAGGRALGNDHDHPALEGAFASELRQRLDLTGGAKDHATIAFALKSLVGAERAEALAQAWREELDSEQRLLRDWVHDQVEGQVQRYSDELGTEDEAAIEHASRMLTTRVLASTRARKHRARRGTFDVAASLRASMRTGGVPLTLVRKRPRRRADSIVLLCDGSESVRHASSLLLALVASIGASAREVRALVFVSDVVDVTSEARAGRDELARALQSGVLRTAGDNSNYARAFDAVDRRFGHWLHGRTTLVVLGDGRSNYLPSGAFALAKLRRRVRRVLWICPESRGRWVMGDSHMPAYARVADQVLSAPSAGSLADAVRRIVRTGLF